VWSGANGKRLWTVLGGADQDNAGWSVDLAGDANGDGYADLIVGEPLDDANGAEAGSALLFARRPYDKQVPFKTLTPAGSPGLFGVDNRLVGDVNNDGTDDLAIGAVTENNGQGVVRVFSGVDQSILHTFHGGQNNIFFGPVVGGPGDINGDGYDDILTGAQHYAITLFEGRAELRSGLDGSIIYQWFGVQPNAHMGSCLGGLGDIDNDGVGDMFVGLLKENNGQGLVRTYSGATGLPIYDIHGQQPGEWFGNRAAAMGDIDDDGITDFVIGCPQAATAPALQGYAVVVSGVDGSQIHRVNGAALGDLFGWCVAAPGDIDDDGYCDFIVGAQNHDPMGRLDAGLARVYSGRTAALLYSYPGQLAGDNFGDFVNGAGDVNGDGYPDYMVGAPGADPNFLIAAGRAYLFSGQDGTPLQVFDGQIILGTFGKGCSGIGDVNGDGYADVDVGAHNDPTAGPQSGAAYLFSSSTKSNPGSFWRYGPACAGSNGKLPKVEFAGRPVVGQSFDIAVTSGPALQLAVLGFDAAQQNIPLAFLGAPACTFLALPLIGVQTATNASGAASLTLSVPNESSIIGANLYVQWILRDLLANPLMFVFSDGGRITFGTP
jgi:hypothetical protein